MSSQPRESLPAGGGERDGDADGSAREQTGFLVLLIEDQPDHARLIQRVLDGTRFRLMHARDGEEGLAMALQYRPDLVLFDMGLPGIEGMQVALALRQDPSMADVRLVAVTAWDQDMLLGHSYDAYIRKPIEVGRFVQTIEDVLAAPPRRGPAAEGPSGA